MSKILHVIVPYTNFLRYKSRENLYHRFAEQISKYSAAKLYTVEIALGDREFQIDKGLPGTQIQLRTVNELWHKERAIGLVVQHLPPDWKYMAWVDADIEFVENPHHGIKDWIKETLEQLQHYQVVQMFRQALDMGPSGEVLNTHLGFAYSYLNHLPWGRKTEYGQSVYHPGYAWAYTREAYNGFGGMASVDWAILGSGDDHLAKAFVGKAAGWLPPGLSHEYYKRIAILENQCLKNIKADIGYVPALIRHYWHGRKVDRKYWERWDILKKFKFDPSIDLKSDWQGLWQLTDRSLGLRDALRGYFRQRHEDANTVG